MAPTLVIVERSHRGAVEQQYAHVLWLVHSLHIRAPITLLLRGVAVVYGVDSPLSAPLRLGERSWGPPAYRAAVEKLRDSGAVTLVCADSLDRLGLADRRLIAGVRQVSADEIALVAAGCDAIWYL